jgi:uncharacterized damage-inducible protein DinB
MLKILTEYTEYNLWANTKMAHLLKSLKPELLDHEIANSFNSLRKTIYHIWDAEYIWLERLMGNSINFWPSSKIDSSEPIDSFLLTSTNFNHFISSKSEFYFEQITNYQNVKGELFSQPNYQIIQHCMNHSTFHRGQLITILREMENKTIINFPISYPSTDLVAFYRQINFK